MRAPLLLTGAPASGKSTTARQLGAALPRAAVIDVDDLRHFVVAGHAGPWEGEEGLVQLRIGIENACDLARRFTSVSIDVLISDVLDPNTIGVYRALLPSVVIVRLRISLNEARRRATLRPVHLTEDEFENLHAREAAANLPVDRTIDVECLGFEEQVRAVRDSWPEAP